jgi:DNA-directed RNA polymerase alpha subunit
MNPSISKIAIDDDMYKFTLSGVNVSFANSLRRTILNDIPTTVIYTDTYNDNQCTICENTGRLHNEILKQRLSCIPVNVKELDLLPNNYILDIDVTNDTDATIFVTTADFRIKNKNNGNFLTTEETKKIFPPCEKTNTYIDFARLRSKIGNLPGETLKLTAEFSVHTAKESGMFNVVSICSYGNTIDLDKVHEVWSGHEDKLKSEQMSTQDIQVQKKNFYLLDAQRQYKEDSFDFIIQSLGVYDNKEIIKLGCKVLISQLNELIINIDSDIIPINPSETTMENSFDIVLENQDYTIGKIIEYVLYDKFYINDKILVFCGFKKFHPHDDESIIRLAYNKPVDKNLVRVHLNTACVNAKEVYEKITKLF